MPIEIFHYIDPVARYVFLAVLGVTVFDIWKASKRQLAPLGPQPSSKTLSIAVALAIAGLCLLVLLVNWSNGGTQDVSAIGGVIPYSDATGYYEGAERLVYEQKLTPWTERRPLNAAFLAARLVLTGNNFFAALILQAVLASVALFLATVAILQTHGKATALWFFAFSFAFVSCCLHRTLSEPLGISLGLVAFALLWSGVANRSPAQYALGTFILSLALLARAGAMFALPATAIFAAYLVQGRWQKRLMGSLAALAAIACAWLVNSAIIRLYGTTDGALLSNFSYTLYGLSQGGTSWAQGLKDFPQLANADDGAIANFLYQKAVEAILAKPYLLVWGLAKSFILAIGLFPAHILRLIADGSDGGSFWSPMHVAIAGAVILPLLGYSSFRFIRIYWNRLDRFHLFLLFQLLAFAASLPFFYLDGGVRLTAATFPLTAATIALALAALTSQTVIGMDTTVSRMIGAACVAIAAFVVLASVAAPRISGILNPLPRTTAAQCEANRDALRVEIGSGSAHINIQSDRASLAPNIRLKDFVVSDANEAKPEILAISKPATVLMAFDANSKTLRQIVGPAGFADGPRKWISLCAEPLHGQFFTHRIAPQ